MWRGLDVVVGRRRRSRDGGVGDGLAGGVGDAAVQHALAARLRIFGDRTAGRQRRRGFAVERAEQAGIGRFLHRGRVMRPLTIADNPSVSDRRMNSWTPVSTCCRRGHEFDALDPFREVNLTPAEWIKGIEFMTAAGKMCTPARQEFILLSDTLGLSALVNGLHDKTAIEEGDPYQPARPVLPRGHADTVGRQPDRQACEAGQRVRAVRPRHGRRRQADRQCDRLDLADRRRRSLRHPGPVPTRSTIAASSPPMRMASTCCAPSSRSAIRSRWTARSAPW